MNIRDDNVLKEMNLYPLWVRRGVSAAGEQERVAATENSSLRHSGAGRNPAITTIPLSGQDEPLAKGVEAERKSDVASLSQERGAPLDSGLRRNDEGSLDWPTLKQQVRDCTACELREGCTQTVLGMGDEKAEWLFVGEGPGADEDERGEPFVGQAGRLLDNMLAAMKLKRGSNVYIANVVKCHPPENRTPHVDEIAQCMPYLRQQIALIKPKLIVALGKTAANALLGKDANVTSLRGTVHDCNGISMIATYHPAYLLRMPDEKAHAWQDLCLAMRTMEELQGSQ